MDLHQAVAAAHRRGVPAIIDGAAQDMRIDQLTGTAADAVIVSAQKFLASPTAGLIVGTAAFVASCRTQERGIGRAMKATKEGILGVLAAIEERRGLDLRSWQEVQARKVAGFIDRANRIDGIIAAAVPDPAGMPFSRVRLTVSPPDRDAGIGWNAAALAARLRSESPPIWLMEQAAGDGHLFLELVALDGAEVQSILDRLLQLSAEAAGAATGPTATGRAPASRAAG